MGRPSKHTVDYFPHFANASDGRTLTIMQDTFGNDGVSAWWRVLERLAQSPDLIFRADNAVDWRFLVAKLHVSEETANKILDLLADIGAIDRDLWAHRLVWSQNFVDNLADVFHKRGQMPPIKPVFVTEKEPEPIICTVNPMVSVVSAPEMPQSIVKESIVNKRKGNGITVAAISEEGQANVFKTYEAEINALTPTVAEGIKAWLDEHPAEHVIEAIKEASKAGVRKANYVNAILENWKTNGYKSKPQPKGMPDKSDPTRYTKGKYGALVQR